MLIYLEFVWLSSVELAEIEHFSHTTQYICTLPYVGFSLNPVLDSNVTSILEYN